ncbi:MAG: hypothetical protein WA635_12695 [Gallionella sp.]
MNLLSAVAAIAVGTWIVMSGGSWSPKPEQLGEIQSSLESFVKQQAAEQHRQLPRWSSYTFQYQGQLDGGYRIVFINAFCIPPPEYSQRQFVFVFDGGPCFFQVKYDPNKKRFFQLTFNGEA